jgi:hypothetical protein
MEAIEQVTMYRTNGKLFDTEKEAIEYRESLVAHFVGKMLNETGCLAKSSIPVTEYLLKNKSILVALLNF